MTSTQFQLQLARLVDVFGKNAFPRERAELIWREVQDFSDSWLTHLVDRFIGECRQAPLLPDFREEISRERERLWKGEKKEHEQDAKDFFNSSYQPDDVRTICQTIIKRIQGGISDEDYTNFQKMLTDVARNNPSPLEKAKCRQCDDSGLVFHHDEKGYEWVYRCPCPMGARKPQSYPVFQL